MKGTKVKCRDCIHSEISDESKLLLRCNLLNTEVSPFWAGCIMGDNGKEEQKDVVHKANR